jgi:6-phosphofructokinase 1
LVVDRSQNDALDHVVQAVRKKGYAVVVVGEGAGEELLGRSAVVDAGGNRKCPPVGPWLKDAITERVKAAGLGDQGRRLRAHRQLTSGAVRYIDPSYMVRSVPANSADSLLCLILSQAAVHAAMAGSVPHSLRAVRCWLTRPAPPPNRFTAVCVGMVNARTVLLPIEMVVAKSPRSVDPCGRMYERVVSMTGQPYDPHVSEKPRKQR